MRFAFRGSITAFFVFTRGATAQDTSRCNRPDGRSASGEGQLHLRVRGLRRGGKHRLGAEVASGGEENLQTDAGSVLIRVYDDAVDERLGHLARKAAICLPPLLDGAAQAFHAPNALLERFVCILQFLALPLERSKLLVAGLIALPELLVRECPGKREVEQLVLAAGDGLELLLDLREQGALSCCAAKARRLSMYSCIAVERSSVTCSNTRARMRSSSWL